MSLIQKSFIERVLNETNIVDLIGANVKLRKQGQNYIGKSPFNDEKTPSFIVSPVKQQFTDYSSGNYGNAINFIQQFHNCDFPKAIEILSSSLGLQLEYESKEYSEKIKVEQNSIKRLRPVIEFALHEYRIKLKGLDSTHEAHKQLRGNRKYNDDIIENWQIGFAPGNKFLYRKLAEKGWLKEGVEIGLINDQNDKYFNRIIYPIYDSIGNCVGLSGRTISKEKNNAKWINPKESVIYKKQKLWYGLNSALKSINDADEVWIVEGYNDVIAFQENGISNTIGSCGTSITLSQIKRLKKYCNSIVLCMDGDRAGLKSILKYLPIFIEEGFKTKVVILGEGTDPDSFVRKEVASIKKSGLRSTLKIRTSEAEGLKFLIQKKVVGDDFNKNSEIEKLINLVSTVKNIGFKRVYINTLSSAKEIKRTKSEIQKSLKLNAENSKSEIDNHIKFEKYKLPQEVKTPLLELEPMIDQYGIFVDSCKIWSMRGNEGKYFFVPVSNFEIEIIQHMVDEKNPMKLLRIKNVHGLEKVFDVLSENLNTPQRFDNAVTAHGNFFFNGNGNDFQKLRAFLFDNMGNGRKIEVLGWQKDNFWVWNNKITLPNGDKIEMDRNGIFKLKEVSYYVPSSNSVYKNNPFKYEPQKKLAFSNDKFSFEEFTLQILKVHGNHAISGILFSVASIFQDFIEKEVGGFPLLFLYGPPSTGKDQLAFCCQSFFGTPQTAINLEGGASTTKGQIRTFAQLSNAICHLSEYKRANNQMDGILKGIWDKRGYVRGNIDSHVGTDNVPILCSAILTGNEYPSNDALITRLIWEEMIKSNFNEEERKEYGKLSDMIKNGVSHITDFFVHNRENFTENFYRNYKLYKGVLQNEVPNAHSRMIGNLATLAATYKVFENKIVFPFSYSQMIEHFKKGIETQMRKLDSSNIVSKFWDCFLYSMRGNRDMRINEGREFVIDGNKIKIQFSSCYGRLTKEWYSQYQEAAPAKSTMIDALKKDSAFIDTGKVRLSKGNSSSSSSVYELDLNKISISADIITSAEWQQNEGAVDPKGSIEKKPTLPF